MKIKQYQSEKKQLTTIRQRKLLSEFVGVVRFGYRIEQLLMICTIKISWSINSEETRTKEINTAENLHVQRSRVRMLFRNDVDNDKRNNLFAD
jgi:hypothetical protein